MQNAPLLSFLHEYLKCQFFNSYVSPADISDKLTVPILSGREWRLHIKSVQADTNTTSILNGGFEQYAFERFTQFVNTTISHFLSLAHMPLREVEQDITWHFGTHLLGG